MADFANYGLNIMNEFTIVEESIENGTADGLDVFQDHLLQLRRAVTEDPRNIRLLIELGQVAEKAGDIDRARWAYKRAIRLEPQNAVAYLNLARLYLSEERTKPAVEVLQDAIKYSIDRRERAEAMSLLQGISDEDEGPPSELPSEAPGQDALAQAWQALGLTPAEALMLMDPEKSSGRQMMQYTLLDLTIRGVLDVTNRHEVGRGDHFDDSRLQPHEVLFAKYFSQFDDYIDLDRLSQAVLSELNSRSDSFKSIFVFQSLADKGYFEKETQRIWGLLPVSRYVLSNKGIRTQNQLKRLLKQTDSQIARTLRANPEQAKAYLSDGGPAILLLDDFPVSYVQEWQEILEQMGLGPTIDRLRDRAQQTDGDDVLGTILKGLLGE